MRPDRDSFRTMAVGSERDDRDPAIALWHDLWMQVESLRAENKKLRAQLAARERRKKPPVPKPQPKVRSTQFWQLLRDKG